MFERPVVILRRLSRKLWVRVSAFAVLSLTSALMGTVLEASLSPALTDRFDLEGLMPVLTILASSMLAVSTFSLNVMVSAHLSAAAQATPRVHRLLLDDTTTQNVLSVFIGAFVYALSSIILLKAQAYASSSAVIMLVVTIAVVVLVILALLRWIDHLSDLGSLDATLDLTESHARTALTALRQRPALGGVPLTTDTVLPEYLTPIPAQKSGYLQWIDLAALAACSETPGQQIYANHRPGQSVLQGQPLALAAGAPSPATVDRMAQAFLIGDKRSFEQDAGLGLLTLSEIASRALSSGVNDPGTAIEAIARTERLLWEWAQTPMPASPEIAHPTVFVPELPASTLISAAFAAPARDGAGQIEVVRRLLKALTELQGCADTDLAAAAKDMTKIARAYAENALTLPQERESLDYTHRWPS